MGTVNGAFILHKVKIQKGHPTYDYKKFVLKYSHLKVQVYLISLNGWVWISRDSQLERNSTPSIRNTHYKVILQISEFSNIPIFSKKLVFEAVKLIFL